MTTAPKLDAHALEEAAQFIREADGLLVAAGAGMGVDSGLPDFRGNKGFWNAYPALGSERIQFEDVASPLTFYRRPRLAWGFYGHRLALYRATVPHAGFDILRRWGDAMPNGSFVYTSNVDGQFQKAGFDPQRIVECHGSIHRMQCLEPCSGETWPADRFIPQVDDVRCELLNSRLPQCPHCAGMARPNILMFGDMHWSPQHTRLQRGRLQEWLTKTRRPVVVEMGAGTAIPSVRLFSQAMVQEYGARLIRINPREANELSLVAVGLSSGALASLMAIDLALRPSQVTRAP